MRRKWPYGAVIAGFALGCVAAALLSLRLGAAGMSLEALFKAIADGPTTPNGRIFYYARLPRTAACLLAGAGLATSGAVIQGVLANRLASPGIIGVSAGAGVSVTVCCAMGAISGQAIAGASFLGAFLAVMTVAAVAQKTGASRSAVILGGVALNSFLSAVTEAIVTLIPEVGQMTADFRVGGFSGVATTRLIPAGVMIVLALIAVLSLSNELDLLSMGEDMAHGLGLSVSKVRTLFLGLAAMLAGASVSFAGLLGFVGLIVPNMARRFTGGESKKLLPVCALFGAAFVTVCDCLARVLFAPYEIATGIVMSALGAPFFVVLLFRNKGGHRHG